MRKFSRAGVMALVVGLGLAVAGCEQVGVLKAQMAFKDANQLYQRQNYAEAAAKYEEALAANPELTEAFFCHGNSYANQYRPTRAGDPDNDALIQKAIENYKTAAQRAEDPAIKQLALQYLVNAFGPEKLNDPSQQEPLLQQMIDMDPNEPGNYFVLANVYEQSGEYERAEELLIKARDVAPNNPAVYTTLAGFYNRQGLFDKTMEALHARAAKEPNNPEAFHLIATYYWEKAYEDFTTPRADKVKYIQAGHEAADKAIELKPDYADALTYKGLLLGAQALIETDPQLQQELKRRADEFREQSIEIRDKQRASGTGD